MKSCLLFLPEKAASADGCIAGDVVRGGGMLSGAACQLQRMREQAGDGMGIYGAAGKEIYEG